MGSKFEELLEEVESEYLIVDKRSFEKMIVNVWFLDHCITKEIARVSLLLEQHGYHSVSIKYIKKEDYNNEEQLMIAYHYHKDSKSMR